MCSLALLMKTTVSRTSTQPPASPTAFRGLTRIRPSGAASWSRTGPARSSGRSDTGSRHSIGCARIRRLPLASSGRRTTRTSVTSPISHSGWSRRRLHSFMPKTPKPSPRSGHGSTPPAGMKSQTTLNQLMQSAAMMMQQAQASGAMAGGMPGMPGGMPGMPPGLAGQATGAIGNTIQGMMPMATGQPPDIGMLMAGGGAAHASRRCRRRR